MFKCGPHICPCICPYIDPYISPYICPYTDLYIGCKPEPRSEFYRSEADAGWKTVVLFFSRMSCAGQRPVVRPWRWAWATPRRTGHLGRCRGKMQEQGSSWPMLAAITPPFQPPPGHCRGGGAKGVPPHKRWRGPGPTPRGLTSAWDWDRIGSGP
jgi:hypothetical protein